MRLSQLIWTKFKLQCNYCACNRLLYNHSSSPITYKCFSICNKLNTAALSPVKEVIFRLAFSTTPYTSKNKDEPEKAEVAKSKKKKEIKTFITLLGSDGNIISVTTVEEAIKLASRRNMRLVKAMDLDPKTGRAVYKLMTESDYLKGDLDWENSKSKTEKGKSIKGDKLVSLSSNTAEHDVQTKVKMMQKWLEKRFEVRVVITGDLKNGENIFKIIEKEIGTDARIVQKRSKGQDIRFQILPPKKTEGSGIVKRET